jgi:mannose-6-phosphate isomerase-like protein (cupin superfamily)
VGTVDGKGVQVVSMQDVEPIELPMGSWSRMVLNDKTLEGNQNSLGYSIFKPGTVTAPVSHEVEEHAYIVAGRGELRLDDGVAPFGPNDALFIPAHTWHAVAVTGDEDCIMVFTFAYPDYPPTERR